MNPDRDFWSYLWGGVLIIQVLFLPVLIGYVIAYQWQTPTMDFYMDYQGSSTVNHPSPNGKADLAGLESGDVILAVDDTPFEQWAGPKVGSTHTFQIERRGNILSLQIPAVRIVKQNFIPLLSSLFVTLAYWGIGTLLLIRRFWYLEIRVLYTLSQCIGAVILIPFSFHFPWNSPDQLLLIGKICFCLIPAIFFHYIFSFPIKLCLGWKRSFIILLIYGLAICVFVYWINKLLWSDKLVIGYFSLIMGFAIGIMVYVYRFKASPDGQRRTRVIVFGALMAGAIPILFYLIPVFLNSTFYLPEWIAILFLTIAPISYLYATQRYNLFGIDRIINRTLVYALLSVGIFTVYLVPYLFFYQRIPNDSFIQLLIFFILTIWIGWTYNWIRSRTQRLVDQVFYGSWYDYPAVIETVSNALARSSTRKQINEILTVQVPNLMRLKEASLWIQNQRSEIPSIPRIDHRFRYIFQTTIPTQWTVDTHSDGDDLSSSDNRILHTIGQQAEIALNNAFAIETLRNQLEEIKASQEALYHTQRQLLRSREEERSRLARDLHDSPIQSLVGMNIQLGLLLNNKTLDSTVIDSLGEMRTEIRTISNELRQVCADLRPPMLDAIGLSAALKALSTEWSDQNSIKVNYDLCPDTSLKHLPGEVTMNLYRVAQEALANIGKHAKAKNVSLSLNWQDTHLLMIIHDDGQGFSAPDTLHGLTSKGHFGLAGMRERINLIGGTYSLTSKPGEGTTIHVSWKSGGEIV